MHSSESMTTPTLIVRLIGLYLVIQNTFALIQVQKMHAMAGGFAAAQQQITGDLRIYAVGALLIGLAATVKAGRLAQMLTFDAAGN